MNYIERPKEIEAVEFDGSLESIREIKRFTRKQIKFETFDFGASTLTIVNGKGGIGKTPPEDLEVNHYEMIYKTGWGDFAKMPKDKFERKWMPKEQ